MYHASSAIFAARIKNKLKRVVFTLFVSFKRLSLKTIKLLLFRGSNSALDAHSVVVLKVGGLGDFIMGIPALNLLRSMLLPGSHISLVTANTLSDLSFSYSGLDPSDTSKVPWISLVGHCVDKVLVLHDLSLQALQEISAAIPGNGKPTVFILGYPGLPLASAIKKILLARLLTCSSATCFGVDKSLDERFMRQFQVNRKLSKHKVLGDMDSVMEGFPRCSFPSKYPDFKISISSRAIKDLHEKEGLKEASNMILLAPLSIKEHKQWPIENYLRLVKLLQEQDHSYSFGLIGTQDHYDSLNRIFKGDKVNVTNLCGRLSLEELGALLSVAKGYVGNDGGMSHLADLVGCPSVIIFNSVEEDWVTYPWRSLDGIVKFPTECSPCYNLSFCPEGHRRCTVEISLESVYSRVIEIICAPLNNLQATH
jgi:heptosyltransferase-2